MVQQKKTTEQFIQDAREKHGDKYDYSLVKYNSTREKVIIICPDHGEYTQTPSNHLSGRGCKQCASALSKTSQTRTSEMFIQKAKEKHGEVYDYSLVEYQNCKTKITIICPEHGEFEQRPDSHLGGAGCETCNRRKVARMQTKTTEKFIEESIEIHGEKYDYSLVNYVNDSTHVTITCAIHGEFQQVPRTHLKGKGCKFCGISRMVQLQSKTQEQFLEEAKFLHGDTYDYSLVEYINSGTKVIIICPTHGEFEQLPNSHIQGMGCQKCARVEIGKMKALSRQQFIEKANAVHEDKYDYSSAKYTGAKEKITIICPEHGIFVQRAGSHLEGRGCPECGNCINKTTEQFVQDAKKVHGDLYNYELTLYANAYTNVIVVCKKHGEFSTRPSHHLSGVGCHKCNFSKGETAISVFLKKNEVSFTSQKRFNNCRDKLPLPFDFYIVQINLLIEFDGEQHEKPVKFFGGDEGFKNRSKKDKIKTDYAYNNSIGLIRITKFGNIKQQLQPWVNVYNTIKQNPKNNIQYVYSDGIPYIDDLEW